MMVNRMFLHFELGKPITGGVIAKVVKSNSINFKENDIVTGNLPWQKHCNATENCIVKIDN